MTNEEAIQRLAKLRDSFLDVYANYEADVMDYAISALERDGWISVDERLPEVDEKVLTFARNKYDGSWFMDITSWTGVKNHDEYKFWGYGDSMKVTHWMPLPEPPKEEP